MARNAFLAQILLGELNLFFDKECIRKHEMINNKSVIATRSCLFLVYLEWPTFYNQRQRD
jgi:hypothetical protein